MLSFDKVSAHYGKIQALHEVSLHINQGEIVTLIGANGAGKTTLLGTLCGDPRATSGRIVFDDKDITDWQTAKIMREAVAIVPEGRRVFSRMTVEENLAMGGFFAERDQFQRITGRLHQIIVVRICPELPDKKLCFSTPYRNGMSVSVRLKMPVLYHCSITLQTKKLQNYELLII